MDGGDLFQDDGCLIPSWEPNHSRLSAHIPCLADFDLKPVSNVESAGLELPCPPLEYSQKGEYH
jgi:hypothetical protein